MKRFKWYRAEWPERIRNLAPKLQSAAFRGDTPQGFALDRVRDDSIEGRYIERFDFKEKVVDPFGEELQFDRVEFRQLQFRIADTRPGLEVIGSSVGSASLVNRLAEAANFRLSVTTFSVDALKWLANFQARTELRGFVDAMQVGKIELGKGVVARAIVRGKDDVKNAVSTLTQDRPFHVEKIQYRLGGHEKGSVTISSSASAVVRVADSARIAAAIREALEDLEEARTANFPM